MRAPTSRRASLFDLRTRRTRAVACLAAVVTGFGGAAAIDSFALAAPALQPVSDFGPAGDGLTRLVVTVPGAALSDEQLAALAAHPGVDTAQRLFDGSALVAGSRLVPQDLLGVLPGAEVRLSETGTVQGSTVSDPYWSQYGWNIANNGSNAYDQPATAGVDVGAPAGWQAGTGAGLVVAVTDTGVFADHPDLRGSLWTNPREACGATTDTDGDGLVGDCHGWNFYAANADTVNAGGNAHGTGVAGIIGARRDNGVGSAGVAPDVTIMPLVIGSGESVDMNAAAAAIVYAVDHGADVINASWGGSGLSSALNAALTYADTHGVIVVAAAGNDAGNRDTTPLYPANAPQASVLTVGSSTAVDTVSSFSGYGASTVDLFAPGTWIMAPSSTGSYALMSGTSMAAPEVAAAVALYRGRYPTATAAQLRAQLLAETVPVSAFAGRSVSGGRLSLTRLGTAASAVTYGFTGTTAVPGPVTPQIVVAGSGTPAGSYRVRLALGMELNGEVLALSGQQVTLGGVTASTDDTGEVGFDLGSRASAGPAVLAPSTTLAAGRYVLTVQMYRDGIVLGKRYAAPLLVAAPAPVTPAPTTSAPTTASSAPSAPSTTAARTTAAPTSGGASPTGASGTSTPTGAAAPTSATASPTRSTGGSGAAPSTSAGSTSAPTGSAAPTGTSSPTTGAQPTATTRPTSSTSAPAGAPTAASTTSAPTTSAPTGSTPSSVSTPGATTAPSSGPGSDVRTYPSVGAWQLTSISPTTVAAAGNTSVTITGLAIPSGATVRIGATASARVITVSTTRLTFATPALVAGTYDVFVYGPDRVTYSMLTAALTVVAPAGSQPSSSAPSSSAPSSSAAAPTSGTGPAPGTSVPLPSSAPGTGSAAPTTAPQTLFAGPNGERLVRSAVLAALAPSVWRQNCASSCAGVVVNG